MDHLSTLPEESLSEILRRTSPADASRFVATSKGLQLIADSDSVWDGYLPSDLPEIVSRSESPVVYANKKELYLSLCHSSIIIDAGKLSFSLEKESGKKCYMVGARELGIIWCGDTPWYWDLTPHPDSSPPPMLCCREGAAKVVGRFFSLSPPFEIHITIDEFKVLESCRF